MFLVFIIGELSLEHIVLQFSGSLIHLILYLTLNREQEVFYLNTTFRSSSSPPIPLAQANSGTKYKFTKVEIIYHCCPLHSLKNIHGHSFFVSIGVALRLNNQCYCACRRHCLAGNLQVNCYILFFIFFLMLPYTISWCSLYFYVTESSYLITILLRQWSSSSPFLSCRLSDTLICNVSSVIHVNFSFSDERASNKGTEQWIWTFYKHTSGKNVHLPGAVVEYWKSTRSVMKQRCIYSLSINEWRREIIESCAKGLTLCSLFAQNSLNLQLMDKSW